MKYCLKENPAYGEGVETCALAADHDGPCGWALLGDSQEAEMPVKLVEELGAALAELTSVASKMAPAIAEELDRAEDRVWGFVAEYRAGADWLPDEQVFALLIAATWQNNRESEGDLYFWLFAAIKIIVELQQASEAATSVGG